MNGAVAFDIFGDHYSDAQDVPTRVRGVPKEPLEQEGVAADEATKSVEGTASRAYVLPLKEMSNKGWRIILKRAIPIYLEGEGAQFVAIHEASRVCGQGVDLQAAVRDFEDAFISIYLSYRDSTEPLSAGAKKYLRSLQQLVATIETI